MRNVSDKSCRENQNTHFVFINFFRNSCHFLDNVGKYCIGVQVTDDSIIWRMRTACWLNKTKTQTHNHNIYYLMHFRDNNG